MALSRHSGVSVESWVEMTERVPMRYEINEVDGTVSLYFGQHEDYVMVLHRDNLGQMMALAGDPARSTTAEAGARRAHAAGPPRSPTRPGRATPARSACHRCCTWMRPCRHSSRPRCGCSPRGTAATSRRSSCPPARAASTLSVEGRANYLGILEAATAAALNVHEQQRAKETEAKLTVMADLAEGIVTRNPASLTKSLSATAINVAKSVLPVLLDDSGADQVCDSYRREADRLCQSLGHGYDLIRGHLAKKRDDAETETPQLFSPLPVYCDVGSPDFTYEHFKNDVHDPGPIGPQVEAERQKYAEEKRTRDSEIGRRLDHGDKGAV